MQTDLRQELREQLQEMWHDKIGRLVSSFACDCGQEVLVTRRAWDSFVQMIAEMRGAAVLPADETALCPNCGAYLLPHWNKSIGLTYDNLGPSIEDTINEMEAAGRLAQAIEELKADAQAKRDRRAGAN